MASLAYLWNNRSKNSIFTYRFYKNWAKRIFNLPELLRRNLKRTYFVLGHAKINETAAIGKVKIDGNLANLSVGANTFLGRVKISLHHEVAIGNNVCINDGVQIITASHDVSDPSWKTIKAKIVIEDYAWIAMNATILPGVTIGKGAVVGAGAVVSRDVAPGFIVVGNPAKAIEKKRAPDLTYNPCEFLAANNAWLGK